MAQASFEPGTSRSRVLRNVVAPHWLDNKWSTVQYYRQMSLRTRSRRSVQNHAFRWPDAHLFVILGVGQWKLDRFLIERIIRHHSQALSFHNEKHTSHLSFSAVF